MARVNFKTARLIDGLNRAIAEIPELADEMETDGKISAQAIRQMIDSRPSAKSGKPGRATGTSMSADITHKVSKPGKNRFFLRVGWLNNRLHWYPLQDDGFRHWRSGDWIEGTHALKDGREIMEDLIDDSFSKWKKRIEKLASRGRI